MNALMFLQVDTIHLYAKKYSTQLKLYFFQKELRKQCQDFATALLDHTRSSYELEIMLNHDPKGPAFEHGDRMSLNRLKLAIKYRQKKVNLLTNHPILN